MTKKLFISFLMLALSLHTFANDTTTIKVGILLYKGVELLDFSGAMDVFVKARAITRGQYQPFSIGVNNQAVATQDGGPSILPDYTMNHTPRPDILIIPGTNRSNIDSLLHEKTITTFIQKYYDSVQVVMSVCTGAYLLAGTGLLDNMPATTHFFVADDFLNTYPNIKLVKDVRFVDNGKIVTTSGVTSGMDGALHLVSRYSGQNISAMVARGIQYTPHEKEAWPISSMHYRESMNDGKKSTCPACGMQANRKISADYKGKKYYFCSESCKIKFQKDPNAYLK